MTDRPLLKKGPFGNPEGTANEIRFIINILRHHHSSPSDDGTSQEQGLQQRRTESLNEIVEKWSRKLVWKTAGYSGPSSWVPTAVVQTKLHSQRAAEEKYSGVRSPDNALKEIHLGIVQYAQITE